MAKPKSKKSNSKSKSDKDEADANGGQHSLLLEAIGLFLLSGSLITVISLLASFAHPSGANILGPYLGDWWATTLNQFAGGLPILFLLAAVITLGFKLVLARGGLQVRIVMALSLLFVAAGMLLSIRNLEKLQMTSSDYQVSGGYLGNFLVHKFFLPFFGQSQFGAYLITIIATVFILVWGFRMSVVALSERSAAVIVLVVRPFFLGLTHIWAKGEKSEIEASTQAVAELIGKNETKKNEAAKLEAAKMDAALKLAEKQMAKSTRKNGAPVVPLSLINIEAMSDGSGRKDATTKADLNAEDEDVLDLNDPLAVRKSRDLNLERKRVAELNDWEVKSRDPEIAGLLQKEKQREQKEKLKNPEPVEPAETGVTEEQALATLKAQSKIKMPEPKASKAIENQGKENEEDAVDREEAESEIENEIDESEVVVAAPVKFAKIAPKPKATGMSGFPGATHNSSSPKPEVKYDTYRVPLIDEIFPEPPKQPLEFTEEELREQSKLLEDQLINFKVMGKVTQICPGPVITRYEVELAPGVKVSRISTLADDLALALRAKSIRILAPIPGKSVVGIEVPNRKAQIVYIKEILRAPEFAIEEDTLKVGLGKSIAGEPYVMDLTRAPHLLIAGQTGSGKSVCINSIMASFLCSKTPDELRMILIDPKVVELKPYDAIPHLLYPVITQPEVAVQALKWSTFEMDRRYETLAQCGVRNIKGFNAKFKSGTLPESMDPEDKKLMSYIVIIIDELADLMMVAGKEVETNIARIAQKARAVGIHLILATQRPSTNVITGTIKANLPTRIAFQVASQIDARTIMDKMGAEKLLGRGDMLFRPIEFPEPVRLHGCYLDDDQAEKLALCASDQFVNYPQIQSFNLEDDPSGGGANDEPRDEKFREAAELVVQVKQASVSLLQRRLAIGYARSGRLVDQLERAGIVGRERGSKPREVLMNPEELESFLSSGLNDD